jgi:hypothetical protein
VTSWRDGVGHAWVEAGTHGGVVTIERADGTLPGGFRLWHKSLIEDLCGPLVLVEGMARVRSGPTRDGYAREQQGHVDPGYYREFAGVWPLSRATAIVDALRVLGYSTAAMERVDDGEVVR